MDVRSYVLSLPRHKSAPFLHLVIRRTYFIEWIFMDRQRSQLLGIILLAAFFLLLACIRYYFKLG
jgi:hypothetical protein